MSATTKRKYRKMLFAKLFDDREVELVKQLCQQERCTVSNLMRRAVASMIDEAGIDRPEGVFDEREAGVGPRKSSTWSNDTAVRA